MVAWHDRSLILHRFLAARYQQSEPKADIAQGSRIPHRDWISPFDLTQVEIKGEELWICSWHEKKKHWFQTQFTWWILQGLDAISKRQKKHFPFSDPCNTSTVNQLFQVAAITFPAWRHRNACVMLHALGPSSTMILPHRSPPSHAHYSVFPEDLWCTYFVQVGARLSMSIRMGRVCPQKKRRRINERMRSW